MAEDDLEVPGSKLQAALPVAVCMVWAQLAAFPSSTSVSGSDHSPYMCLCTCTARLAYAWCCFSNRSNVITVKNVG